MKIPIRYTVRGNDWFYSDQVLDQSTSSLDRSPRPWWLQVHIRVHPTDRRLCALSPPSRINTLIPLGTKPFHMHKPSCHVEFSSPLKKSLPKDHAPGKIGKNQFPHNYFPIFQQNKSHEISGVADFQLISRSSPCKNQ